MKKLFTLMAVAGMFSLVACGPSAEEKAAAEKAVQDSIANAEAQMKAAEEAAMAAAAATPDSMAPAADSAAHTEGDGHAH